MERMPLAILRDGSQSKVIRGLTQRGSPMIWKMTLALLCVLAMRSDGRAETFSFDERPDRLVISYSSKPVADFVFGDEKILRPYFSNVRVPGGPQVTRNHPPIADRDATDHAENHPGIWLGFGDVSGHDFWRNKGRIEHVQFVERPVSKEDTQTFATESRLLDSTGKKICDLISHISLVARPAGILLIWEATFRSNDEDFTFGDQEEMGFGARVATAFTEKNGGTITNSRGQKSAATTWGQPAAWCDYSGTVDNQPCGITLMAAPANFRESWWHNRDYGVFVANPFGRAAMKQGAKSTVTVKQGESFRIVFGAEIHGGAEYDIAKAYADFVRRLPETSQSTTTKTPSP